jgi:hypothetical protein
MASVGLYCWISRQVGLLERMSRVPWHTWRHAWLKVFWILLSDDRDRAAVLFHHVEEYVVVFWLNLNIHVATCLSHFIYKIITRHTSQQRTPSNANEGLGGEERLEAVPSRVK